MYARRRALPTKPAMPVWKWLIPLLLGLLLVGGIYTWLNQPRNPPLQPDATTRTVAQDWQSLKAFGARPVGEKGHDQAVRWLSQQLTALGYRVTEQAVPLSRPFDLGGSLRAGQVEIPVAALYGAAGGEQEARLVQIPPDASVLELEQKKVMSSIALTTCPKGSWNDLVDRVLRAGAFGLVLIDDCPVNRLQKVSGTPMPLVKVQPGDKARVLALVGQQVTLTSKVEMRQVTGHNLIAARVKAKPEIVFGAHLDTVNGSPGANDNSSGVLAVLNSARDLAQSPLANRAWFVLFDAEEDGVYGSRAFVKAYSYPLRDTRAMLNFDMVGVNAQPLGIATTPDLLALARQIRPGIRAFEDEPVDNRQTFGRSLNLTGRSDHVNFKLLRIRTAFFHTGMDANYHAPTDQMIDLKLVEDTSQFAEQFAEQTLKAPWTPDKVCGITGRDCRN